MTVMTAIDDTTVFVDLLRRREGFYHVLLAEADRLLTLIDAPAEAELLHTVDRSQEILESIQKIDSEITARYEQSGGAPPRDERKLLEEFAGRRKLLTDRILEKDSLVAALANGRLEEIRQELSGLSKGRMAVQAYESSATELAG